MPDWSQIWPVLVAIVLAIVNFVAVLATLVGLPGVWFMLALALVTQWYPGDFFSWWTLGICFGLALLGELIEFAAGAMGSSKAGGSIRASAGALIGGIAGAILGSATPPLIGAIIWGAVGAFLGAVIGEVAAGRTVGGSLGVGQAAAVGRVVGTLAKGIIAAVIYATLTVASFIP